MKANQKVLIIVIAVGFLIIGLMSYMTYIGIRGNPEYKEQIQAEAQQYLDENYDGTIKVVDVFHDNMDIYQEFVYAAIAEIDGNDNFQILVFYDNESGEMIDSIVAETWEHELELFLEPILDESFGNDISEVWITYPKNIGEHLNISSDQIPSLNGQEAFPVIRITVDRAKEDDDEDKLDEIINILKNDLNIAKGNITLSYNDNALFFKSKSIIKEIK